MTDFYARDGQPLDFESWAGLREDDTYRRVAETWIDDGIWVSTVWLGINYSFTAPPLIFETMVFAAHLREIDHEVWRCSTESEARVMHQVALSYVQDALTRRWW